MRYTILEPLRGSAGVAAGCTILEPPDSLRLSGQALQGSKVGTDMPYTILEPLRGSKGGANMRYTILEPLRGSAGVAAGCTILEPPDSLRLSGHGLRGSAGMSDLRPVMEG